MLDPVKTEAEVLAALILAAKKIMNQKTADKGLFIPNKETAIKIIEEAREKLGLPKKDLRYLSGGSTFLGRLVNEFRTVE